MAARCLIVGLGNPGRQYAANRHNAGFHVLDALAQRHALSFSRLQERAAVASGHIAGRPVILAKPQSYMNESGRPTKALMSFYKLELADLLVVVDDLDLPPGTIRLKPSGGAAGQNGMRSIIQHLKSEEFARLRVGIGRPPGKLPPREYVLQDFSADEGPLMQDAYDRACDAIETWLREDITLAMSRHNGPASAPPTGGSSR